MCLAIPAQVVELDAAQSSAVVETFGVQRQVSTYLLAEALSIGDYLLIHVGFAISKIDQQQAAESLATYRLLLDEMNRADDAAQETN